MTGFRSLRVDARGAGGARLFSVAEVAAVTGRNRELVRRWCASGRIQCQRVGRDWLIDASQLERIEAMPRRGRTQHPAMVDLADLGILPPGLRTEVEECLAPGERVRIVVLGTEESALVATDQKLLAARDGSLWKDPATGQPVIWPVRSFRRVQADLGAASGALVLTPRDPEDRALVLVLARPHLERAEAGAHALRELLEAAGSYRPEGQGPPPRQ